MATEINNRINPELWVQKYGDDFFGYAHYCTGKKMVAENIVQETFISALKSSENFEEKSNEKTWLLAILKNKITNHFRGVFLSYKTEENPVERDQNEKSFLNHFFDKHGNWNKNQCPANWHDEEDDLSEDDEFKRILKMCLKNLPENRQALINLKFLEKRATYEVCKELGIELSAFWDIMHLAMLQLRACIEENFLN